MSDVDVTLRELAAQARVYTFHRAEGFYPLHMPSGDAEAIANAECNPGTLAVRCAVTGRLVWGAGNEGTPVAEEPPHGP